MFERARFTTLQSVSPQSALRHARLAALSLILTVTAAAQTSYAQTAPATPAAPVQAVPATTPATPAAPAPVAPATRTAPTGPSSLPVSSALAVEVSAVVKGRLVSCPKGLKLSGSAVCLYTQNTLPILRSLLRAKLSSRILSDWKTGATEKTSSLVIKAGAQNAFVLLAQLSATETLVVVDGIAQTAAAPTSAPARPAMPAGIVKGQPYVLDTDLKGLVNVVNLGGGSYRLASVAGGSVLTVSSGAKSATFGTGKVELALAPVSDGRNLLFPVDGLRALACTVTPAQVGVTVACGTASANIRPIVF
ncbi:hypothetical protein Q0M94_00045 [Deinococcus radiomollis]|uniref:hypothetical protein n=1 Tax=Deinococcus radiomollis TaxID=468916 RepID=UPI003892489A